MNPDVKTAIDLFCEMATNHPSVPQGYSYVADRPGAKRTRIVMIPRVGTGRSVHAFVDNESGDLFKAAGWKAPAKGARGNLVTGFADVEDRFDWSGRYLYAR